MFGFFRNKFYLNKLNLYYKSCNLNFIMYVFWGEGGEGILCYIGTHYLFYLTLIISIGNFFLITITEFSKKKKN